MKTIFLAFALMLATASASAQTIYTQVDLNGHKSFSDRPGATPEPAGEAPPRDNAQRVPAGTMARGSKGAALVDANEAQRRFAQAQLERTQGMQPLSGERAGVKDANAINNNYWKRQEHLRLQVDRAQLRLNATRQLLLLARQ